MPETLSQAICRTFDIADENQVSGAAKLLFMQGAVWGMQAAKLSQSEIAAIAAAVATEKEKI